jgi:hypothetical protein
MLHTTLVFHPKTGAQAELPEDHCDEQEAPEHKLHDDDEARETYEN